MNQDDLLYIKRYFAASLTVLKQFGVHDKGAHKALSMLEDIIKQNVSGWQPMETAPRDGTEIITCCLRDTPPSFELDSFHVQTGEKYEERADGLFEKKNGKLWETWNQNGHRATHWMPLPEAPRPIKQESK